MSDFPAPRRPRSFLLAPLFSRGGAARDGQFAAAVGALTVQPAPLLVLLDTLLTEEVPAVCDLQLIGLDDLHTDRAVPSLLESRSHIGDALDDVLGDALSL